LTADTDIAPCSAPTPAPVIAYSNPNITKTSGAGDTFQVKWGDDGVTYPNIVAASFPLNIINIIDTSGTFYAVANSFYTGCSTPSANSNQVTITISCACDYEPENNTTREDCEGVEGVWTCE